MLAKGSGTTNFPFCFFTEAAKQNRSSIIQKDLVLSKSEELEKKFKRLFLQIWD